MNTPVAHPQIAAFVAAVRAELDDLSGEEVEELTGGLEADLRDAISDPDAPRDERLADAAGYAAELRAAAGLPPRAASGGRHGAVAQRLAAWRAALQAEPWWPAVRDFAITVRPVWWVARAAVPAFGVHAIVGGGGWLLWILFSVISVEIGRRRLAGHGAGWRLLVGAGNVLAVLTLPLAWAVAAGPGPSQVWTDPSPSVTGLSQGGVPVGNVFPYDAQGHPMSGVQLFDQNGQPLDVEHADGSVPGDRVPAVSADGRQLWNVYPLREQDSSQATPTPSPAALPTITPGNVLIGGAASSSAASSTGSPSDGSPSAGSSSTSPAPGSARAPTAGPTASSAG
jgi:hypothetical protein